MTPWNEPRGAVVVAAVIDMVAMTAMMLLTSC
jgi:hypothetical protein